MDHSIIEIGIPKRDIILIRRIGISIDKYLMKNSRIPYSRVTYITNNPHALCGYLISSIRYAADQAIPKFINLSAKSYSEYIINLIKEWRILNGRRRS